MILQTAVRVLSPLLWPLTQLCVLLKALLLLLLLLLNHIQLLLLLLLRHPMHMLWLTLPGV